MTLKPQRHVLHMIQHTNNYQTYQKFKISDFKHTLLLNPLNLASVENHNNFARKPCQSSFPT